MKISLRMIPDISAVKSACKKSETILAVQILKDTVPYVPAKTGAFFKLGHVVGRSIIYPRPTARYLYYGKRMVDAATGRGPWFIEGVGYRWTRKAELRPTDTPLNYTTTVHAKAGPKWVERSLADNKDKWAEVARKAVSMYG